MATTFYKIKRHCQKIKKTNVNIPLFNEVIYRSVNRFLKIPKGQKTELLISLGYPDENPEFRPRKTIEKISEFYK
ncbi:MAG TPA: hypothetical protein VMW66_05120 [Elusimicrobiales bacterium]|nr:hypothetical protein [Elusimicrobiales bacterium]